MVGRLLGTYGENYEEIPNKEYWVKSLNYDELNALMIEVEAVINSRPLTYVSDDSDGINYTFTCNLQKEGGEYPK